MWKTAGILTWIVFLLVGLGIIMLASTSAVTAEARFHDSGFFVKRQIIALIVGCISAFIVSRIPYSRWKSLSLGLGIVSVLLLVLVFAPGIGLTVKGSTRWLEIPGVPMTIQPSEFAKFGVIALLACWISDHQRNMTNFWRGFIFPMGIVVSFVILILREPDFGTSMLIGAVGVMMLFIAGTPFRYLIVAVAGGGALFAYLIFEDAERMRRILAFLNPEKYADNEAFQLIHALYAFVVGGPWGVGLGNSLQKRFYLPEAHTDFIYAITGEEFGIIASLGVVALFVGFFVCGYLISLRTRDQFGKMLAFGITSMISLQAAINIGVVTACLPTKGLPLPFISFGGTSLVMTLTMVGVLINIAQENASEDPHLDAIKDRSQMWSA